IGSGYFSVSDGKEVLLTRDGRFQPDREGHLVTVADGNKVLDEKRRAIAVGPGPISIGKDGTITQAGQPVGKIGVFDVPKQSMLVKRGGEVPGYPGRGRPIAHGE